MRAIYNVVNENGKVLGEGYTSDFDMYKEELESGNNKSWKRYAEKYHHIPKAVLVEEVTSLKRIIEYCLPQLTRVVYDDEIGNLMPKDRNLIEGIVDWFCEMYSDTKYSMHLFVEDNTIVAKIILDGKTTDIYKDFTKRGPHERIIL